MQIIKVLTREETMKQKQEVQNRFHIVNLDLNRCFFVPWVLCARAQNPNFLCNLQVPLHLVTKPAPGCKSKATEFCLNGVDEEGGGRLICFGFDILFDNGYASDFHR